MLEEGELYTYGRNRMIYLGKFLGKTGIEKNFLTFNPVDKEIVKLQKFPHFEVLSFEGRELRLNGRESPEEIEFSEKYISILKKYSGYLHRMKSFEGGKKWERE